MFKMKKLAGALALTIALAQVTTAVPVQAAETYDCWHEGCDNKHTYGEGYLCDECNYGYYYEYVNADETHHKLHEVCSVCDYEKTYDYLYDCVDSNEDGICEHCEVEYDCGHEECDNKHKTGYEGNVCKDCEYESGYKKVDETHHVYYTSCPGCDYGQTYEYLYECADYDEDGDGKCDLCEDTDVEEEEKVYTCEHDGCENELPEGYTYGSCEACWDTEWQYAFKEDDANYPADEWHIEVLWCNECDEEIWSGTYAHYDSNVDGKCDACGYEVGMGVCWHEDCDNEAGYNMPCKDCQNYVGKIEYEFVDENCHYYSYTCSCGTEFSNWTEGHYDFDKDEKCDFCGGEGNFLEYDEDGIGGPVGGGSGNGNGGSTEGTGNGGSNGGSTEGTGNGGSTEGTGNGGSTGGNGYFDYTDTTVVDVFKNVKSTCTVAGFTSTVNGAYILEQGVALAITTPVATIAQAFGLAADETPYVKAFDMDIKKSNLAFASLEIAAKAFGGTNVAFIQMEFGKMSAKGVYSLLPAGPEIQAMFSIPAKAQVAGAKYAVIRVVEGGAFTLLKDTDNNPATVSFVTTGGAGAYAIIRF